MKGKLFFYIKRAGKSDLGSFSEIQFFLAILNNVEFSSKSYFSTSNRLNGSPGVNFEKFKF